MRATPSKHDHGPPDTTGRECVLETVGKVDSLGDIAAGTPSYLLALCAIPSATEHALALEYAVLARIRGWRTAPPHASRVELRDHAFEASYLADALIILLRRHGHRLQPGTRRVVRRIALDAGGKGSRFCPALIAAMRDCITRGRFRLTRRELTRLVEPVPGYVLGYRVGTASALVHQPRITRALIARVNYWLRAPTP